MSLIADKIHKLGGIATNLEEIGRAGDSHVFALIMRSIDMFSDIRFPLQKPEKARRIRAVLIASYDINAIATSCVDEDNNPIDLIGLNAGTIAELAITFKKLIELDALIDLKLAVDGVPAGNRDEALELVIAGLTNLAIRFVLWHEVKHLVNGHVDYLNNIKGVQAISELESFAGTDIDILRYTLEYDADCSAVNSMCFHELDTIADVALNPETAHPICAGLRHIHATESSVGYYFGFCVCTFFSLSMKNFIAPYGGRHHPASHVRMMWVLATIATLQCAGRITNTFTTECTRGCVEAFIATAKMKGEVISKDEIFAIHEQSMGPLQKEIQTEWALIRPFLEPFTRAGKIAAADPDANT